MLSPEERERVERTALEQARDEKIGLSMRFIREWDIKPPEHPFDWTEEQWSAWDEMIQRHAVQI